MKYILFLLIVLISACHYKEPETHRIIGTEERCYVVGDFPGSKDKAPDHLIADTVYSTSPNRDYIKPDARYFIVFYSGFTNKKKDAIGYQSVITTNGFIFNDTQFIYDILKKYRKKGVEKITITGFNELSKKDFDFLEKNKH